MLDWIRSLFRPRARRALLRAAPRPASAQGTPSPQANPAGADASEPKPALPQRSGLGLDHESSVGGSLQEREQRLLARVGLRVGRRQLELPQLPSTSLGALDLCNRPEVEIQDIVTLIGRDPVLSSELLRTANSVLYVGSEPAQTLYEAVVRVGLRTLRSMLYAVSVRGAILGDRSLATYAEEVWRQSSSCAAIARALARPLGLEAERAYLLGLLHDIGKLPLLSMLRKAVVKESDVTPALVGRVFRTYHEEAGKALALAWHLPEDVVEVAARHHDFAGNQNHRQAAALVSLVHKIDLYLSLGGEDEFRALVHAREFEFLAIEEGQRSTLLARAQEAFEEQLAERSAR